MFRSDDAHEYFEQEFHCGWLDTEGALFSHEDIAMALAAGEDVEAIEIGETNGRG